MNYLIIADAHLGVTKREAQLKEFVAANKGSHFIWLGDTFDILAKEDAYVRNLNILEGTDHTLIEGNHDYGLEFALKTAVIGKTFLVHGDMVDFGYGFARLQQASYNGKGTLIEKFLALFRKWSIRDVYTLYEGMYSLSDEQIARFRHPNAKLDIPTYIRIMIDLFRSPRKEPEHLFNELPAPNGHGWGGYFTEDPKEILTRVLALHPFSRKCDTIIIGHLHRDIDEVIEIDNRSYRLIVLSSWIHPTLEPTVARIDDDGEVSILHLV